MDVTSCWIPVELTGQDFELSHFLGWACGKKSVDERSVSRKH